MVIFHSYNTHFLQATLGFELPTHGFDQRVYEEKNRDRMGQKPWKERWSDDIPDEMRQVPVSTLSFDKPSWKGRWRTEDFEWAYSLQGSAKGQKNGCRMLQVSGVIETLVLWIDHVSYLIETHGLGRSTTQFWCFMFGYRFLGPIPVKQISSSDMLFGYDVPNWLPCFRRWLNHHPDDTNGYIVHAICSSGMHRRKAPIAICAIVNSWTINIYIYKNIHIYIYV